jgi:hypothetical protein
MTVGPGPTAQKILALAALGVPTLVLAWSGGWTDVVLAAAACALGAVFRWVPALRSTAGSIAPPLAVLVVLSVTVPPTLVDATLAAISGVALLLWIGSDGRTMASTTDRLGALGLPGFAAFLALATALATRGAPPSFGIAVAGGILVAVLIAAAVLISQPPAPTTPASSS